MWQRCRSPRYFKRVGAGMATWFERKHPDNGVKSVLYDFPEALEMFYTDPADGQAVYDTEQLDADAMVMFQYCSPNIPEDDVAEYNDDNMGDPSPPEGVHHLEQLYISASDHFLFADEYRDVEQDEDTAQHRGIWYASEATTREECKESDPECQIKEPVTTRVCTIAPSVFYILLSSPTRELLGVY